MSPMKEDNIIVFRDRRSSVGARLPDGNRINCEGMTKDLANSVSCIECNEMTKANHNQQRGVQ